MKFLGKRLAAAALALLLAMNVLLVRASGQGRYDRVLKLHAEEAGACYQVYAVADLLDVLFGVEKLSREPTPAEQEAYCVPENRVAELVTDEAAEAEINLTEAGLEDGVYLIAGQAGEGMYVCVPAPDPDGEGWLYTVDVYPGYKDPAEHPPTEPPAEIIMLAGTEEKDGWCLRAAAMCLPLAFAVPMVLRFLRKRKA